MRQTKMTPTPPTSQERDKLSRTYSYCLDGAMVSLTNSALKQIVTHRRDAASASRKERRRMAAILRGDKLQMRANKAIQRQLDKVQKRFPQRSFRVRVSVENRRIYRRKKVVLKPSKAWVRLPRYDKPIIDRQGRQSIVMVIDYDGAKKHSFGIVGRRIIYATDPEHCELNDQGSPIFYSNMGADLSEILMGADLLELAQRGSRIDAKTNVNIILQLPHDVSRDTRAQILRAVSHELFGRHGLPFVASLHRPDPDGDQRNFHAHICASWRPMKRKEAFGWDLAEDYRADLDGADYWRHARRRCAEIMTSVVSNGGLDRDFTHLSNAERGLVHKPQKKLEKRKTRAAREGEFVADVVAMAELITLNQTLQNRLEAKRTKRREMRIRRALAGLAKVGSGVFKAAELSSVAIREDRRRTIKSVRPVKASFEAISASKLCDGVARKFTVQPVGLSTPKTHQMLKEVRPAASKQSLKSIGPVGEATGAERSSKISPVPKAAFFGTQANAVQPVAIPVRASIEAVPIRYIPRPNAGIPSDRRPFKVAKFQARISSEFVPIRTTEPLASQLSSSQITRKPKSVGLIKIAEKQVVTSSQVTMISLSKPTPNDVVRSLPGARAGQSSSIYDVASSTQTQSIDPSRVGPAALSVRPINLGHLKAASISKTTTRNIDRVRPVATGWRLLAETSLLPVLRRANPSLAPIVLVRSPLKDLTSGLSMVAQRSTVRLNPSRINSINSMSQSGPSSRLMASIEAFEKRLRLFHETKQKFDISDAGTGTKTAQPSQGTPTAETLAPLSVRIAKFASAMREKPTGLCVWSDGSVHPVAAIASTWGLSQSDLRTQAAKQALLALYVDQELQLDRLESELCDARISEKELRHPKSYLKAQLSKEAAETFETYRRSALLLQAFDRVSRVLWRGEKIPSRTSQMEERDIDWLAINAASEQRKASIAAYVQKVRGRQKKNDPLDSCRNRAPIARTFSDRQSGIE